VAGVGVVHPWPPRGLLGHLAPQCRQVAVHKRLHGLQQLPAGLDGSAGIVVARAGGVVILPGCWARGTPGPRGCIIRGVAVRPACRTVRTSTAAVVTVTTGGGSAGAGLCGARVPARALFMQQWRQAHTYTRHSEGRAWVAQNAPNAHGKGSNHARSRKEQSGKCLVENSLVEWWLGWRGGLRG
jgi:hypothetical protein